MDKLDEKLVEKSKEAFCLAIELYNKPTIKYRVEGFSHFICNAWELMLKAHMLNVLGESSIYYKDNHQRTLSVSMKMLNEAEIIAKYPEPIANHFIELKTSVDHLSINNNAKFAIRIDHHYYITKNKDKATNIVHFDKNATSGVTIIKELQDPNNTHNYTAKSCINIIKERLQREHIELTYNDKPAKFTSFHFVNFCKYYSLKENEKLCYIHRQFTTPQYSYSQQMIDFIVDEIMKDPMHILDNIKK